MNKTEFKHNNTTTRQAEKVKGNGGEKWKDNKNSKGDGGAQKKESNNNNRSAGNNKIPNRWLQYEIAIGEPMEGTRFIAFKTPLSPLFFKGQEQQQQPPFAVNSVIKHIDSLDRKLGLVIDLTDTDRYYNAKQWEGHQVEYLKIRCPGHEVNDDDQLYQKFKQKIHEFLEANKNNDRLIGVHCTHGLNRTGFLICRYLIQEYQWNVREAIESFGKARGYPMEREAYIRTLHDIHADYYKPENNANASGRERTEEEGEAQTEILNIE